MQWQEAREIWGEEFPALSCILWLAECQDYPSLSSVLTSPRTSERLLHRRWLDNFPHLREIAVEIPAYDHKANVKILIGRDAPELLKIRESRNGPKGAPWAQQLDLGWTVSGQMCLDRVGGPVHISTRRKAVKYPDTTLSFSWSSQDAHYRAYPIDENR